MLPKEGVLREAAEKKDLQSKLKDIDDSLDQAWKYMTEGEKITPSQMQALLAECRWEADAIEMMEVSEDLEDDNLSLKSFKSQATEGKV